MELTKDILIAKTLENEGGYCNVPGDSGGMTYKGIAYNYNKNWEGWAIVKKHLPLKTNAFIKDANLDKMVIDFYDKKYYTPSKCSQIVSPIIRAHLYDMGVNAGMKTAAKILQKAINKTFSVEIGVDGLIGPNTLKYANDEKNRKRLEYEILNQRNAYYKSIATGSRKKFLTGWLKRSNNLQTWAKQFD